MESQEEFIRTLNPRGHYGIRMPRSQYESICQFLLSLFNEKKELTFNELIEKGHEQFMSEFGQETGWYLYNVKLDLEARGLLRTRKPNDRRRPSVIR